MNFGTYELQTIIYEQLKRGQVEVRMSGGRSKFAKDLAKLIYEKLELEEKPMNVDMRTEFLARGGSMEDVKMFDRLCKVFSFDMMPLTESAREVYKWIAEQEAKGQKLETFVAWARGAERAQYINKYRKDAGNIRNDWALVFSANEKTSGITRQVDRL